MSEWEWIQLIYYFFSGEKLIFSMGKCKFNITLISNGWRKTIWTLHDSKYTIQLIDELDLTAAAVSLSTQIKY